MHLFGRLTRLWEVQLRSWRGPRVKPFLQKKRILQAYLSFEALSDHTYTFSCVTCGYHPVSVVMDLHKKGVFSMPGKSTHLFFLFVFFLLLYYFMHTACPAWVKLVCGNV